MSRNLRRYSLLAGAVVALGAIGVLVYRFDPASARFFPQCLFHAITGLQCPGCGGTRAVHQLLHGNFVEAIRLNALIVAAWPLLVVGLFFEVRSLAVSSQRPVIFYRPWVGWSVAAVVALWGVGRNLI